MKSPTPDTSNFCPRKEDVLLRREVDARRLAALGAEQELAAHRRQAATTEREIADIKARLASIPLEIASARSEAATAEASLQQRRVESEARRLQFITAPISGRVASPAGHNRSIDRRGGTVAVILPTNGRLEVELLARPAPSVS
ncbi:MAG: hypothetical protein HC774_00945 [Sphingomonadales bacterium]|nr:hypothetical protein [Sphingomonadales bacterium]